MSQWLLALNVGSSSVKFAAFPLAPGPEILRGALTDVGANAQLMIKRAGAVSAGSSCGALAADLPSAIGHAINGVFSCLDRSALAGVGHRIVHGGAEFIEPALLTTETLAALHLLEPLAPLHQPASLAAIDLVARRASGVPQFGCFDTAFHATQPRLNRIFALPRALEERGLRRYGFHGLSYEHVAQVMRQRYGGGGRAVAAHLGAGASLCALKDGVSVATSMGMTPLGGVPMATRPGDLDPGAIVFLLETLAMSASQVRDMFYFRSGLLGLSAESGDMQTLLASTRPEAAEAVSFYVESVQREIASMAAALGGLDTLVFTAGVGANAPAIRARIGAACAWLGVHIDPALNQTNAGEIQAPASAVRVLVAPADEEAVIAGHIRRLLTTE